MVEVGSGPQGFRRRHRWLLRDDGEDLRVKRETGRNG